MLIAARALLGIAAATIAPSTLSLIRNMFLNPKQRTFAIGMWATTHNQQFHPLNERYNGETTVLNDLGFRCEDGIAAHLKLCQQKDVE
jgi:hypothetical protein